MAKWWPFGRKKEETPAPEPEAPAAPKPEAPAPAPSPEPEKGKKGLLGRLFGRKKKPEPEAEPVPAPEPSRPSRAAREEPLPGTPEAAPEPETKAEAEAEAEAEPERTYPASLTVSIHGTWVISKTRWTGTITGHLTGSAVRVFLDGIEGNGDEHAAIRAVLWAYDADGHGFASGVDLDRSTWNPPEY